MKVYLRRLNYRNKKTAHSRKQRGSQTFGVEWKDDEHPLDRFHEITPEIGRHVDVLERLRLIFVCCCRHAQSEVRHLVEFVELDVVARVVDVVEMEFGELLHLELGIAKG